MTFRDFSFYLCVFNFNTLRYSHEISYDGTKLEALVFLFKNYYRVFFDGTIAFSTIKFTFKDVSHLYPLFRYTGCCKNVRQNAHDLDKKAKRFGFFESIFDIRGPY